jgi:O-antigen/teichoic acid export membrane protein
MNIFKFFLFFFDKKKNERVFKNFTSLIFSNISLTVLQILFPLLMIKAYGLENFGIWIFLTAIPATLSILNFNIGDAARVEMSINYNLNNEKKTNEIFNNLIILTFMFVAFIILITALIINFYDFDLNILKDLNRQHINIIMSCIFLSFYLTLLNSIFTTGITFWGRKDVENYLDTFFNLFTKFLIVLFGFLFNELFYAAIALLIATTSKLITSYFFFLNYNKYLTLFSFKLISKKKILKLFKLSIPYYFMNISGVIQHSFQIVILGIFFNSQIVGSVSTLKTLFYFMPCRVWGIFFNAISFEFIKLYSEKKFILLKKMYFNYLKLGILFLFMFFFISIITGEYIYNFWLNNSYNVDYIIFVLIIFDVIFFIATQSVTSVSRSLNKFFEVSFLQIMIHLIIILISCLFFYFQQSYYLIFIFNVVGSILIMFYSIYFTKKFMKKYLLI